MQFTTPLTCPQKNDEAGPADTSVQDAQELFRQPTAQEVARLTYAQLHDRQVCAQAETRNHFAHLLNRGSPLE